MPETRRSWNENDVAKLKSMAGRLTARDIAAEMGRSPGAVQVEASKLGISLRRARVLADHVGPYCRDFNRLGSSRSERRRESEL